MKKSLLLSTESEPIKNYSELALELLEDSIHLFAWRYRIPYLEIEDTKQELRMHLWRKLSKYAPKKASLRTWAWTVMRRKMIDLSRRDYDVLDRPERVSEFFEDTDS